MTPVTWPAGGAIVDKLGTIVANPDPVSRNLGQPALKTVDNDQRVLSRVGRCWQLRYRASHNTKSCPFG